MDLADLDVLGAMGLARRIVVLAGEQENKPLITLWDIAERPGSHDTGAEPHRRSPPGQLQP